MAKAKHPGIQEVKKQLAKDKPSPVYFLYGDDSYSIKKTVEALEAAVGKYVTNDFDSQTFYGSSTSADEILDFALSFPFGSGKKLCIVKEFEKLSETKSLENYFESPSDFTVLAVVYNGTPSGFGRGVLKKAADKKYIYEAKELKQKGLLDWIMEYASEHGKKITNVNAQFIIDITGEDRNLIEMQIEKMMNDEGDEITFEQIQKHSIATKEYNIFDLQNAISENNRKKAFETGYRLLEQGESLIGITVLLNRYFTGLAQIDELDNSKVDQYTAARAVGTHPYFYKNYVKARRHFSYRKLYKIAKALQETDITLKSSSTDEKTVLAILLHQIFN